MTEEATSYGNDVAQEMYRLNTLFADQRRAFRQHPVPTLQQRRNTLSRLQQLLSGNSEELAAAVSSDFGNRAAFETRLLEIFNCCEGIRQEEIFRLCRRLSLTKTSMRL